MDVNQYTGMASAIQMEQLIGLGLDTSDAIFLTANGTPTYTVDQLLFKLPKTLYESEDGYDDTTRSYTLAITYFYGVWEAWYQEDYVFQKTSTFEAQGICGTLLEALVELYRTLLTKGKKHHIKSIPSRAPFK